MQKFQDYIFSSPSVGLPRPVPNATVLVLNYPAMTVATIYSDNGITTTANPFLSAGDGKIAFYAADGHYSIQVSGQGINGTPTTNDILLEDAPADFVTLAQLAASSGSSLVGFIQSGTGADATDLQARGQLVKFVWDYLTPAERIAIATTGTTDVSAAIMDAHNALPATGGVVYLGLGGFGIGSKMTFTKPITLIGETRENATLTRLFKLSTLNDTAIVIGVSNVSLENFALTGQGGNGGNGIDILGVNAYLKNINVSSMGNDGIRVGDTIGTNCNLPSMINVESRSNGRHGVYMDSSTTDAGGGTFHRLFVHNNTGDGLKLDRAQLNTFTGIVSETNTGYGINLAGGARDNTFYGGDSEVNTAGNFFKDPAAIRNNVFATWGSFALGARVFNSAGQTLTTATATAITFNSERWDTDACHSTSVNTSRLTCNTTGKYVITGHIIFTSNATGFRVVFIKLSNATIIGSITANAVNGNQHEMMVTATYDMAVGDYVELFAYQNSGGNLDTVIYNQIGSEFSMVRQN